MFCSMMTSDVLYIYYTMEIDEMKKVEENFEHRVRRGDENLYLRIKKEKIDVRIFLLNWIMTLFTRVMDLDLVARLWDILLCNELSEKIIIEVCYHLLVSFKGKIMDEDLEGD